MKLDKTLILNQDLVELLTSTYIGVVHISDDKKGTALARIHEELPNSSLTFVGSLKKSSKFLIKTRSGETNDVLKFNLEKIDGISNVEMKLVRKSLPKVPRNYSSILMIALMISWCIIFVYTFGFDSNPLNSLTNSQLLMIEITIATAISIWLFLYDRKSQQEISDVLANIDLLTNEINENVKDIVGDK